MSRTLLELVGLSISGVNMEEREPESLVKSADTGRY